LCRSAASARASAPALMLLRIPSSRSVQTPARQQRQVTSGSLPCGPTWTRKDMLVFCVDANLSQIWVKDGSGWTRRSGCVAPLGRVLMTHRSGRTSLDRHGHDTSARWRCPKPGVKENSGKLSACRVYFPEHSHKKRSLDKPHASPVQRNWCYSRRQIFVNLFDVIWVFLNVTNLRCVLLRTRDFWASDVDVVQCCHVVFFSFNEAFTGFWRELNALQ
jgi:hypothetical protein